jgi:hypothetical protein
MGSAAVRLRSRRAALLWWLQVCADDVIVLQKSSHSFCFRSLN